MPAIAHSGRREVLYVIACGSPLARDVGKLVALAQQGLGRLRGPTPDGLKFVDPSTGGQTGHPVRIGTRIPASRTCCRRPTR